MLFAFKKKKPIDLFRKIKKPHLEEAYIKFPGKRLRRVSKTREESYGDLNGPLIQKLQRKYRTKYTAIHTHPSNLPVPSARDLVNFLRYKERKAEIIIPLNKMDNMHPSGYFVMKKNKNFDYDLSEPEHDEFAQLMAAYDKIDNIEDIAQSLRYLSSKYKFSYRFFPTKGTPISREAKKLRSSRHSIETLLSIASFALPSLLIAYGTMGMTGYTILSSSTKHNPQTSTLIFIVGLCLIGATLLRRSIATKKTRTLP